MNTSTFQRVGFGVDAKDSQGYIEHLKTLLQIQGRYGLHQEVVHHPTRYMQISNNQVKLYKFIAIYQDNNIKTEYDYSIKGGKFYCSTVKGLASYEDRYSHLLSIIEKDGYVLRGDAIEIILVDGSLTRNPTELLKEIQIAVIDH